jgi:hypothetical protein
VITSTLGLDVVPDLLVCAIFGLCCFGMGVAWAAYRAVGWVERIRTWANDVHEPQKENQWNSSSDW